VTAGDRQPDVTVKLIKKGQVATFEVEGGFARRPAPCDGLLVETSATTILIPMDDLRVAGLETADGKAERRASRARVAAGKDEDLTR
jgi:hypothetical protein